MNYKISLQFILFVITSMLSDVKETLQIDEKDNLIRISSAQASLQYFILSTEAGKKICSFPLNKNQTFSYEFSKQAKINAKLEGYCCVGVNAKTKQIESMSEKMAEQGRITKKVYCSKMVIKMKLEEADQEEEKRSTKSSAKIQNSKYFQVLPADNLDAFDIQFMLQYLQKEYGELSSLETLKNCLFIDYESDVKLQSMFKCQKLIVHEKEAELFYWIIHSHRPLSAIQPQRLIELPLQTHIQRMIIQGLWIAFCTDSQVIFLHLYDSLKKFLTVNLKVQELYPFEDDKVALFSYKYIHFYKLHKDGLPQLYAKVKIKSLEPYTLVIKNSNLIVGGINYSNILNEPSETKQILVLKNFIPTDGKVFRADHSFEVCHQNQFMPIKNLIYFSNVDLFACTCGNSLYVFHLQTQNIVSVVQINNSISKACELKNSQNLFALLLKPHGNHDVIKVGFEIYQKQIGTEVENLQLGEVKDFVNGKDFIFTDGFTIEGYNDRKIIINSHCLGKQMEKIKKLCYDDSMLCFLTSSKYEKKIYFIQL